MMTAQPWKPPQRGRFHHVCGWPLLKLHCCLLIRSVYVHPKAPKAWLAASPPLLCHLILLWRIQLLHICDCTKGTCKLLLDRPLVWWRGRLTIHCFLKLLDLTDFAVDLWSSCHPLLDSIYVHLEWGTPQSEQRIPGTASPVLSRGG